jgi:hypothetical protein
MRLFGKTLASAAVLALVGGFSLGASQAAPSVAKTGVSSSSQIELVAAKKKAAKPAKKKAAATAKKAGPGKCGVGNYWDKKAKKCASAAAKKS